MTRRYLADLIERLLTTLLFAAAGAITACITQDGHLTHNWPLVVITAVVAAGASLLKSIGATAIGDPNSASLAPSVANTGPAAVAIVPTVPAPYPPAAVVAPVAAPVAVPAAPVPPA